jgi:hypothetical protein
VAQIYRYIIGLKFVKLSALTLVSGAAIACASGTALASDAVVIVGSQPAVAPVTQSQSVPIQSKPELTIAAGGDTKTTVQQSVLAKTSNDQSSITATSSTSPVVTEVKPNANSTKSDSPDTAVSQGLSSGSSDSMLTPIMVSNVGQPNVVAGQPTPMASRAVFYKVASERSASPGLNSEVSLFTSPMVSDSTSSTPPVNQNNTPLPSKPAGLLSALTLALSSVVLPDSTSNFFSPILHNDNVPIRTLSLLILVLVSIQGFILFVQKAGYTRAPRAGLESLITFATPRLMSHLLPNLTG